MTQIRHWLLILCHQRHDFQLKIHHESGRAPYEPARELKVFKCDSLAGFDWDPEGRKGKGGRKSREEKEGRERTLSVLQTDRRQCFPGLPGLASGPSKASKMFGSRNSGTYFMQKKCPSERTDLFTTKAEQETQGNSQTIRETHRRTDTAENWSHANRLSCPSSINHNLMPNLAN